MFAEIRAHRAFAARGAPPGGMGRTSSRASTASPWTILFAQFKNVLIVILLIATVLSAFLGHPIEAIAIAVIVLFAVLLGFVQEYRADRAIEALRQMAAPTTTALRDGEEVEIAARDLVPGDVILLRAGDKIPADARLIEAVNLQIEEASLTGESVPVENAAHLPTPNWPWATAGTWRMPGPPRPTAAACDRRRNRNEHRVWQDCPNAGDDRRRQNAAPGEPGQGRRRASAGRWWLWGSLSPSGARGQPLLGCSFSALRWRLPWSPRPCRRWSISLAIGVQRMSSAACPDAPPAGG